MTGEGRSTAVLRHRIEMHVQTRGCRNESRTRQNLGGGDGI